MIESLVVEYAGILEHREAYVSAIKANEESLDIDEDKHLDFVINTSIINT